MAVLFPSVACLTLLHSCAGDCRSDSLTAYMVFSIYIDQHSMVCCLANKHGVQLKQCIVWPTADSIASSKLQCPKFDPFTLSGVLHVLPVCVSSHLSETCQLVDWILQIATRCECDVHGVPGIVSDSTATLTRLKCLLKTNEFHFLYKYVYSGNSFIRCTLSFPFSNSLLFSNAQSSFMRWCDLVVEMCSEHT